jgi:hypothetical protein
MGLGMDITGRMVVSCRASMDVPAPGADEEDVVGRTPMLHVRVRLSPSKGR